MTIADLLGSWLIALAFTTVLMLAGVLVTVACGQRSVPILLSAGFASLAALGYATFWVYLASAAAGRVFAVAVMSVAAATCLVLGRVVGRAGWRRIRPFGAPAAVVAAGTLFNLALGSLYGGRSNPTQMAQFRYIPLPVDNSLPLRFAAQLQSAHRPLPDRLAGPWQSSDRPPLQTGIYLLEQGIPGHDPRGLHYLATGVALQALWILGLWAFLVAAGVHRRAIALVLGAVLFSGFAIVNTLFVWPKLVAAAFALAALAIVLFGKHQTRRSQVVAGVAAALDIAWGMLSHPGTAYAVLGAGLALLVMRRGVPWRLLAAGLAALIVLMVPWSLYQRVYDPPANRLTWGQLAPGTPYDRSKSTTSLIAEAYGNIGFARTVGNKARNLAEPFRGELVTTGAAASLVGSYLPGQHKTAAERHDLGRRYANVGVFRHVMPALGFAALGPLFLLYGWLRRRYRDERRAELRLATTIWAVVAATFVVWALVIFGPGTTLVHQGPYVLELLGLAGGVLAIRAVSRRLATVLVAVQSALAVWIYWAFTPHAPIPGLLSADPRPPMQLLTVVSLPLVLAALALVGRAARQPDRDAGVRLGRDPVPGVEPVAAAPAPA